MIEKREEIIKKNTIFLVGKQRVICLDDLVIDLNDLKDSYFILNYWQLCEYPDLDVIPVSYVKCRDECDYYSTFEDNILIGKGEELCLI